MPGCQVPHGSRLPFADGARCRDAGSRSWPSPVRLVLSFDFSWADVFRHRAALAALLYSSHYFAGWAHERSGHRDEAIAAYRQALSVIPNVRSATTLLAAQLFLGDSAAEREEAYRLLDRLYKTPQAPDSFVAYRGNDARLWQTFMTRLREAL